MTEQDPLFGQDVYDSQQPTSAEMDFDEDAYYTAQLELGQHQFEDDMLAYEQADEVTAALMMADLQTRNTMNDEVMSRATTPPAYENGGNTYDDADGS